MSDNDTRDRLVELKRPFIDPFARRLRPRDNPHQIAADVKLPSDAKIIGYVDPQPTKTEKKQDKFKI